jgi:hypothetical protein
VPEVMAALTMTLQPIGSTGLTKRVLRPLHRHWPGLLSFPRMNTWKIRKLRLRLLQPRLSRARGMATYQASQSTPLMSFASMNAP